MNLRRHGSSLAMAAAITALVAGVGMDRGADRASVTGPVAGGATEASPQGRTPAGTVLAPPGIEPRTPPPVVPTSAPPPAAGPSAPTAAATDAVERVDADTVTPIPATPVTAPVAATAATPGPVTGVVEHLWADTVAAGPDTTLPSGTAAASPVMQTWVATPQRRFRALAGPLDTVAAGSSVSVTLGTGDDDRGYPAHGVTILTAPAPAVIGGVTIGADTLLDFDAMPAAVTHEVTVVLALPAGASMDSTTVASFRDRVAGPVNGFWSAQSRGQRAVTVTGAHSWVSLTSSCSGSPFDLWNEAASRVGWSAGTRKHLLLYIPPAAGCGAGLGTVGSSPDAGGFLWVSHNSTDVIAHELGHNFGLGHSNGLLCPSSADGTYSGAWSSGCAPYGYRDYYDVMGVSWGNLGTLASTHADRLGLLSSSSKVTVATPSRVRLAAVSGDGLRVVKISDAGGTYYIEYRPAVAADAWLTGNWRGLDAGVLVRRVSPVDERESLLLDGSVTDGARTSDWQASLGVGRTLVTASGRIAVSVDGADGSGATISVSIDGRGPAPEAPAPTDGAQVTFSAPADGASVPAGVTTFSGVATAPGGTLLWDVMQGGTSRASGFASTGGNGTFAPFTFPVSLPPGTYTVRARVPDESSGEGPGLGGAKFSRSVTITVT